MSFESVKRLSRNTAFRLTAWYTALIILSVFFLHVHEHWLLNSIVRENNHNLVMEQINKYTDIEKKDGLEDLLREVRNDHLENMGSGFFIRLVGEQGGGLWITLPNEMKESADAYLEEIAFFPPGEWHLLIIGKEKQRRKKSYAIHKGWEDPFGRMFRRTGKDLHIYGRILSNGSLLQVGKTTPEWDIFARNLFHNYFEVMLPAAVLGLLTGIFLARRALRPVRDLINTVKEIETGRMDARVPLRGTGGELDELVRLFNGMLERIQTLVTGMRQALDNVAHDLRTPLSRMKVAVEESLQSGENIENMKESLSDCAEELEQIVEMLDALMDVSEAETGVMKLLPEQVMLSSLVAEVVDIYGYVAEEKNIVIETSIPEDLVLYADRARIRQAFANLLDNAIKYTPKGRVKITAWRDGDNVTVSFEDVGEGIASEDIPHIFDRLYRCDRSRSRRGLGLGLSFVKAVLEAHHGGIQVRSELNRGSTFTITLPATHGSRL